MSHVIKYFPHINEVDLPRSDLPVGPIANEPLNRLALLSSDPIGFLRDSSVLETIHALCNHFGIAVHFGIPQKSDDYTPALYYAGAERIFDYLEVVPQLISHGFFDGSAGNFPPFVEKLKSLTDRLEVLISKAWRYEDNVFVSIVDSACQSLDVHRSGVIRLKTLFEASQVGYQSVLYELSKDYDDLKHFECLLGMASGDTVHEPQIFKKLNAIESPQFADLFNEHLHKLLLTSLHAIMYRNASEPSMVLSHLESSGHQSQLAQMIKKLTKLQQIRTLLDMDYIYQPPTDSIQELQKQVVHVERQVFAKIVNTYPLASIVEYVKKTFFMESAASDDVLYKVSHKDSAILSTFETFITAVVSKKGTPMQSRMQSLYSSFDETLSSSSKPPIGVDTVSVHLEQTEALNFLFNDEIICKYELLFRLLFKLSFALEQSKQAQARYGKSKQASVTCFRVVTFLSSMLFYLKDICFETTYTALKRDISNCVTIEDFWSAQHTFLDKSLKNCLLTNFKLYLLLDDYLGCVIRFSSDQPQQSEVQSTLSEARKVIKAEKTLLEGLRYYSVRNYEHSLSIDLYSLMPL